MIRCAGFLCSTILLRVSQHLSWVSAPGAVPDPRMSTLVSLSLSLESSPHSAWYWCPASCHCSVRLGPVSALPPRPHTFSLLWGAGAHPHQEGPGHNITQCKDTPSPSFPHMGNFSFASIGPHLPYYICSLFGVCLLC